LRSRQILFKQHGMTGTALIADIGGTNVRFALLQPSGEITDSLVLSCADYPHVNEAIADYYSKIKPAHQPDAAAFAVAAPPHDAFIKFVNQPWEFYLRDVKERHGFRVFKVVNDFTAVALSLPHLADGDRRQIGGGAPQAGYPLTVLGPGTGLGVSTLVPARDPKYIILTNNEGGHFTIPPMTDRESDVLQVLRRRFNHVSAERVLSGPGLANIYEALRELDGLDRQHLEPAEITSRALASTEPHAHEALEMFCAFLGTAASNVCITAAAYGGVYLAGGILPRIENFFEDSKFRKRFETKGRFSHYLEVAPTYLIKHPLPAFVGLKALLRDL
jgi:glucokinase